MLYLMFLLLHSNIGSAWISINMRISYLTESYVSCKSRTAVVWLSAVLESSASILTTGGHYVILVLFKECLAFWKKMTSISKVRIVMNCTSPHLSTLSNQHALYSLKKYKALSEWHVGIFLVYAFSNYGDSSTSSMCGYFA